MARTWLSIRVDLVSGHGGDLWPRPGRILAAARSHTFAQFAESIDDAFARWDHAHLHLFTLADGTPVTPLDWWDGEHPDDALDGRTTKLSRLQPGEQFAYVFDLGDCWAHLCTVAEARIDPQEELGIIPDRPLPTWGWGQIPDQYARAWDSDDGESPAPRRPRPALGDLPPILPEWGTRQS
ncbi:plasmid pRiA4b ORF-3 family protein [Kineosporia babensis]|uniref:Plasmid pRiA4b ORF-3 family protein n=1 Tax=Kineosporia babensis TaxID=499548 RepID=A0A9X1SYE7_9ACTN|nr:plasmid pRiA4b ORF-3 family protein [Kineosporia babensis]MCD5316839.1 plasmid pRiA4b ORF-3 family protein [Kineosporia babensis]